MLEKLQSSDFVPHLHSEFRLHNKQLQKSFTAELSAVELHPSPHVPDRRTAAADFKQSFSLIFHAHKDTDLPQGIYSVEHKKLGKVELFLVPVGMRTEHARYEAAFNFTPLVPHEQFLASLRKPSKKNSKTPSFTKKKTVVKKKAATKKATAKKAVVKKKIATKKAATKKAATKKAATKKAATKKAATKKAATKKAATKKIAAQKKTAAKKKSAKR